MSNRITMDTVNPNYLDWQSKMKDFFVDVPLNTFNHKNNFAPWFVEVVKNSDLPFYGLDIFGVECFSKELCYNAFRRHLPVFNGVDKNTVRRSLVDYVPWEQMTAPHLSEDQVKKVYGIFSDKNFDFGYFKKTLSDHLKKLKDDSKELVIERSLLDKDAAELNFYQLHHYTSHALVAYNQLDWAFDDYDLD